MDLNKTPVLRGKPRGRAGDWIAEWQGEKIACVHNECRDGLHYFDAFDELAPQSKFDRYVKGLEIGRVITTRSGRHPAGHPERERYISLWTISNLVVGRTGPQSIDFDLVDRLGDFRY